MTLFPGRASGPRLTGPLGSQPHRFHWAFGGGTRQLRFTGVPRPPFRDDSVFLPGRLGVRTRPLVSVERRACSLDYGVPLTRRWLQVGDATRRWLMERWEPRRKGQGRAGRSRATPGTGAASLSELRPRHACPVRTRTRHPGAAAGCAGAAGRGGRGPRGGRGQRLIVRSVARRRWPPGPGLEVGAAAATASTAAASSSAAAALQPTRCLGSALLSQNGCRCRGRGSLGRLGADGREEDHRAAGHRPQVGAEAPQLGHQRGQDGAGLPAEAGEARALCAGQRRPRRLVAELPRSGRTGRRLCVPGARGPSLRDKPGLPAASRAAAGRAPRPPPRLPRDVLSVGAAACRGRCCRTGRRWVHRPAVGAQRVHRSGSEAMVSLLT